MSIGETLGAGNMGTVRAALDGQGRHCALKRPLLSSPLALARFAREVEALERLGEHPNLAALRGSGEDEQGPWLMTERIFGRSLLSYITSGIPVRAGLAVARQVAEALAHAHALGIAHRDVKPGNILVEPSGRAVLIDFGVAWFPGASPLTGELRPGTRAYQASDDPQTDPRAGDLYALGLVIGEILGGAKLSGDRTLDDADPDTLLGESLRQALTDRDPQARPKAPDVASALAAYQRLPLAVDETADIGHNPPTPSARVGPKVGRYEVRAVIGQGGMGVVYLAYDPQLDRMVAIKRVNRTDRGSVERFRREARAVARLDHPNVVRVLDFGVDDAGPYLAMSFVDGPTLADRLRQRGIPDRKTATGWLLAVGGALSAAHSKGLVHRDVKPGNVLLDGEEPKLTDFGLVAGLGTEALTRTDQLLGTPAYMAPEQASGGVVDTRTDIYALGAMAYELFSGRAPFVADHPAAVVHKLLHEEPEPLSRLAPDLPPLLVSVVHRAIEKDPEDRYASVDQFLADLRRAGAGEAISRSPVRWRKGGMRLASRARRPMLALSIALLAALALLAAQRGLASRALSQREREAAERLAQVQRELDSRLSSGDRAGAEEAFLAFAELPDHRGTEALARGWLAWGRSLEEMGDRDAATEARASAFVSAKGPELQREALVLLGGDMLASLRWDGLEAVLRALDDRGLGGGVDDLRFALAAAQRRAPLALALDPSADASGVLRALSKGRRLELTRPPLLFDIDRDNIAEAIFSPEPGRWVSAPLSGDDLQPVDLVYGPHALIPLGQTRSGLLALGLDDVWYPRGYRLLEIGRDPRAPRVLAEFQDSGPGSAIAFDLDPGDDRGDDRVYLGTTSYQRNLIEIAAGEEEEDPWTVRDAHVSTSATNSEIEKLVPVALSGPSAREILVYSSAWSAYDLRLFGHTSGALEMLDRRKVGPVSHPVVLVRPDGREQIAFVRGQGASPLKASEPPGLYVLGPGLSTAIHEPFLGDCVHPFAGDIDGDGLTDIIAQQRDGQTLLIARQRPDYQEGEPLFSLVRLNQVAARGVADVDADGDHEIIARLGDDEQLWVLGAGSADVPPIPPPSPGLMPSGIAPALVDAWSRADVLAQMGLSEVSAASFERLSLLDSGETGARASLRVGELRQARPDEAAAAFLRADRPAASAQTRIDALRGAADALTAAHRFERAAQISAQLAANEDLSPRERERRSREASRQSAWGSAERLPVDLSLGAPWRLIAPLAVDASEQRLRIRSLYEQPVAKLALTPTGERIGVEVALHATRIEWGAGLAVSLGPEGGPSVRFSFTTTGGNNSQELIAICEHPGQPDTGRVTHLQRRDVWEAELTLRLDLVPSEGLLMCSLSGDLELDARLSIPRVSSERWELEIDTSGRGALVDAEISSITATGLRPAAAVPSEREAARAAIAQGRPERALSLPGDDEEARLLRAVALDDLGRWEQSEALFRSAFGAATPGESTLLQQVIRTSAARRLSSLRAAAGSRWPVWFGLTYGVLLRQHREDPLSRTILLEELGPLPAPSEIPPDDRIVIAYLAGARSAVLRKTGRGEQAREQALLAAAHAAASPETLYTTPVPSPAGALLELARALALSDKAGAFDTLAEALALSPSPEVMADYLSTDEDLATLRGDPRWESVVLAARKSSVPWPPK